MKDWERGMPQHKVHLFTAYFPFFSDLNWAHAHMHRHTHGAGLLGSHSLSLSGMASSERTKKTDIRELPVIKHR